MSSSFQCISSSVTEFNNIPLTKYRSAKTGLQVVHVGCPGPLVNGYFLLATEALDDDGCPHTLEHLVFLGSEDYPYKGVLDSLANRALARGTNAWTDVDHTAYTLTTAGSEGFLAMLPIYLDHILYPTLTESGYYTEIHHLNDKGENAGVVYSEMQGRENTQGDLMHLAMQRELYAGTGYQSETGGLMLNLRSLKLQKIRDFHKQFYRPDNLCLVITGIVDQHDLLAALEKVEQKILSKGPLVPTKRPWLDSQKPGPLVESVTRVVDFPDEEESVGSVMIAWRGPKHGDYLEYMKILIIDDYLTDSVVSLLQKEFVEIEDPFATSVSMGTLRYLESAFYLDFEDVPKEKLDTILPRFQQVLADHLKAGIDQARIDLVISKLALKFKLDSETGPSSFFVRFLIYEFLYSSEKANIELSLKLLSYLNELKAYSAAQWKASIETYFLKRPFVCVVGNPSSSLMEHLQSEEKDRIAKQAADLGADKLENLGKVLAAAKEKNELPIPPEIFKRVNIPSADNIPRFKVETFATDDKIATSELGKHIKTDPTKPPFSIQFDAVESEFVEVSLYVDTQHISDELRNYLELYMDIFFISPIKNGAVELTHEQVVNGLEQDTVSYNNSLGLGGSSNFSAGAFGQLMVVSMKVEKDKYEKALDWLENLAHHAVIDPLRLTISASKLVNEIPSQKREGMLMCHRSLQKHIFDNNKSNVAVTSVLKQEEFLKSVLQQLEGGNVDEVVAKVDQLRSLLFGQHGIRGHVIGNIKKLPFPLKPWSKFPTVTGNTLPVQYSQTLLTQLGSQPSMKMFLVSMPAIESCFMAHMAKGPNKFDHADIASLKVINEYLTTMEGLFWKEVRGAGLAYGASLRLDVEAGLIFFIIYRSPDAYAAFEVVKNIMKRLETGAIALEDTFIEAAKSSVTFSIVSQEETASSAAEESFINTVLRRVEKDNSQKLLQAVLKLTKSDLQVALTKYLLPLFDPATSCGAISMPTSKIDDRFSALGYDIIKESV